MHRQPFYSFLFEDLFFFFLFLFVCACLFLTFIDSSDWFAITFQKQLFQSSFSLSSCCNPLLLKITNKSSSLRSSFFKPLFKKVRHRRSAAWLINTENSPRSTYRPNPRRINGRKTYTTKLSKPFGIDATFAVKSRNVF